MKIPNAWDIQQTKQMFEWRTLSLKQMSVISDVTNAVGILLGSVQNILKENLIVNLH
jgi:hypothetical protein